MTNTRRAVPRKWIRREIATLDPVADSERIVRLTLESLLPPVGERVFLELLFTVSLMRVMGELEGAAAVDRDGKGKVYHHGDRRTDDTIHYLTGWMYDGAGSPQARSSAAEIKRIHDSYARHYSMSNETFIHTIAYFTVQIECLTEIVGAPGFTDVEKEAQVRHWRTIGEYLGVRDMPETWDGMIRAMRAYEADPAWFAPSDAGHRVSETLVSQFGERVLPRGFRWLAKPLILSLHDDHVLEALGLPKPRPVVTTTMRAVVRAAFFVVREVLPDRHTAVRPAGSAGELTRSAPGSRSA